MTDSASPDKEHNLETTTGNRIAAFTYLMDQPILSQTFEYPLEEDAFNIYSSPLGQKLAALTLSNLPLSADGKAMPEEVVASEAKKMADELGTMLSEPFDLDTQLTGLSDRTKENYRKAQEGGLTLEQMLDSFRIFLENVAGEVRITTNATPSLSPQDSMMIMIYLQMGWFIGVVTVTMVGYGSEDRLRLEGYQRPVIDALVELARARYKWGGNREKPLATLWDSGVTAGGKDKKWEDGARPRIVDNRLELPSDFHESAVRLNKSMVNLIEKESLLWLIFHLEKSTEVGYLKRATWRDYIDEKRKENTDKRKINDIAIPLSQLEEEGKEPSVEDRAFNSIDVKITLEQVAQTPTLSDREKEVVTLRISIVKEEGRYATSKELGKLMGVSTRTVDRNWNSARKKIKEYRGTI